MDGEAGKKAGELVGLEWKRRSFKEEGVIKCDKRC